MLDEDSPNLEPLYHVLAQLNAAGLQWHALAQRISDGYGIAYGAHKGILKNMEDLAMADPQTYYFVLSLVAVSFSGGYAAALLAPWVVGPTVTGTAIGVVAGLTEAAEMAAQKGVDVAYSQKVDGKVPYVPTVLDPMSFGGEVMERVDDGFL